MKLVALAALAVLVIPAGAGCSNKPAEDRKQAAAAPADESRPVEPARSAAPTAAAPRAAPAASAAHPADFPSECVGYAELIDKLKACDQLGGARASLLDAYETLRSAWSSVPADRRGELARQCSAQAESLRSAAAAACRL